MDFNAAIDIYCERTGPELWAEPLNAITNLAFLLAAWLCWRHHADKGANLDQSGTFLMGLVGAIGLGSGLFHTFATRWAMIADVVPIAIFIHAFLYFAAQRFFALSWQQAALIVIAFFAFSASVDAAIPHEVLNGSGGYIPPFAALVAMGAVMLAKKHPYADLLMIAAAIFSVSLTFRTIDQQVCAVVPFGTHFLWHVLNGASLYFVGKAYLCARRMGA